MQKADKIELLQYPPMERQAFTVMSAKFPPNLHRVEAAEASQNIPAKNISALIVALHRPCTLFAAECLSIFPFQSDLR